MADVLNQRSIGIDLALTLAKAALETARARNYPRIGVAVTNRAGQIMVLLRPPQ